jgi:hypothetical protein
MRLPHFSGTKPNTQGGLITGSSTASSGGGGGGSSSNTQSITLSETAQEYKSLSAGATLKFSFEGGTHTLEVDKIAADRTSADFILSSDPIKFTLKVGEEKIIDLVTSISEQLYVKLNSINSARADVTVKRLSAKKPLEIIQLPKKTEETSSSQATQTESSLTEEAEQDTSPQEISMNQKQDKPILGFVAAVLIVVLGLGAYLYILKRRQ